MSSKDNTLRYFTKSILRSGSSEDCPGRISVPSYVFVRAKKAAYESLKYFSRGIRNVLCERYIVKGREWGMRLTLPEHAGYTAKNFAGRREEAGDSERKQLGMNTSVRVFGGFSSSVS